MGDKNNQLLLQQMQQMIAAFQAQFAKAQEKSPLQQAFEKESTGWMDFMNNPNRDYASYKPLNFDLQGAARRAELAKRTATGGVGLGEINPALTNAMRVNAEKTDRRGDAVNLEQNVEGYNAAMHGEGMNIAAGDQANRTNLAGMSAGMANNATQNYYQFYKPQRSIWSKLAGIGKFAAQVAPAFGV